MQSNKASDSHIINSLALQNLSSEEFREHRGEYAVLVEGRIASYHATNRDALIAACMKYRLGQFSVLKVEPQPVDMGFTDCANYPR